MLDATSSFEVGTAGTATGAGTLTVDAGATLTSAGSDISIDAPSVVDNGSIVVAAAASTNDVFPSLSIGSNVSGIGTVVITTDGGLTMMSAT